MYNYSCKRICVFQFPVPREREGFVGTFSGLSPPKTLFILKFNFEILNYSPIAIHVVPTRTKIKFHLQDDWWQDFKTSLQNLKNLEF